MATVTGSLVVELGLNTAKLITGMRKAERRISDFSKQAKKMALAIAAVGAAAVAAAATGLFAITKSTADTADQIGKLSIRLGTTTEALSELGFVAQRSGVSVSGLQVGLQRMTRRVSEAAAGTGEAVKALKELGINVQDIVKLRPEDQFEAIADALHGLENQSDRVRLAFKLFDTEGVGLLQTMTEGAEGIRKIREEARKFGITISQQTADDAAKFNDIWTNIGTTLKGVKLVIGAALLPVLIEFGEEVQKIAEQMVAWVKANGDLIKQDVGGFLKSILDVIRGGTERVGAFVSSIKAIKGAFVNLAGSQTVIGQLRDQIEEVEKEILLWGKALENPIFANSNESIAFMREQLQGAAERWAVLNQTILKLRPTLNIVNKSIDDSGDKTQDVIKESTEAYDGFFSSITTDQIEWENKFISSMIQFSKQIDERLKNAGNATKTFWADFKDAGTKTVFSVASVLEKDLFDLFEGRSRKMKDIWSDVLSSMKRQIAAFVASQAVKLFLKIIFGIGTGGGSAVLGFFKNLLGFQQGTAFVGTTGPAIVHEGERILSATQNKDLIRILKMQSRGINSMGDELRSLTAGQVAPQIFDNRFIDVFGDIASVARNIFTGIQQSISQVVDFRNDLLGRAFGGINDFINPSTRLEDGLTPRPGTVNITVEGNVITEQDLVQTVKDGIDILNEDIFDINDVD